MPRGDKSSYTDKQKRQAIHIEEGYEHRGVKPKEAKRRAWATVNKTTQRRKKRARSGPGSARENHTPRERKAQGRAAHRSLRVNNRFQSSDIARVAISAETWRQGRNNSDLRRLRVETLAPPIKGAHGGPRLISQEGALALAFGFVLGPCALGGFGNQSLFQRFRGDADIADFPVDHGLDALQVRQEAAFCNGGDVRADAALFLGLATTPNVTALDGTNPCDFAMSSHKILLKSGKLRHPASPFKHYFN